MTAERAALAGLGGGCQVPIGIHCFAGDEGYSVVAAVAAPDGSQVLRVALDRQKGLLPEALGEKVAEELLRQGAQRLLALGVPGNTRSEPAGAQSELSLCRPRILVTRARHQAGQLSEKLRVLGAQVVEIPAIEIVPPESYTDLDRALRNLSQYQWLMVTSANGAHALGGRMQALGLAAGDFSGVEVAAVGSATARAVGELGLQVAVTPEEYVAESLVEALGDGLRGSECCWCGRRWRGM